MTLLNLFLRSTSSHIVRDALRFYVKKLALTSVLVCAIACSPQFDWRSAKLNTLGDPFALEFPGKPLAAQRSVLLAGETVVLTLQAVQTDGAQFALGTLPANSAAQAERLAKALADSFASKMHPPGSAGLAVKPPFEHQPIVVAGALGAVEFRSQSPTHLAQAQFMWTAKGAYELLAIGKGGALPAEVAEQFIRSFKFER